MRLASESGSLEGWSPYLTCGVCTDSGQLVSQPSYIVDHRVNVRWRTEIHHGGRKKIHTSGVRSVLTPDVWRNCDFPEVANIISCP